MINIFHHPLYKKITTILLIIIATFSFIQLFAHFSFKYDSFSFNIRANISPVGGTRIIIPPIGQLFLKSHAAPWQLIISLNEINFAKLEKQIKSIPPKQQWLDVLQSEVKKAILTLFAQFMVFGLLGGLTILLILRIYPPARFFWYGMAVSFFMVILIIGGTLISYDQKALERPQYQGALESAPWAMNLVAMSLDNIDVIGDSLRKVSEGLPLLYKQAGQIENIGELQPDLTALHVSDIHNNPAAFEFISQLVTNFEVNFIIDSGDLTDYGTALEAKIINKITQFKVPYVFIPGNHDSPLIIERLKNLKNVKVIEEGILVLNGLTIAGIKDPASKSYNSDGATAEAMKTQQQKFTEAVLAMPDPPGIVAVHNSFIATDLVGKVPLIIHGHDHKYNLTIKKDTVINDAGTTGAAGIRGLTPKGVPYSAAILYWKKNENNLLKLKAVDSIKINGTEGRLIIERHTF